MRIQKVNLIINLMISAGIPFLSFLVGTINDSFFIISIIGMIYLCNLNFFYLLKLLKKCGSERIVNKKNIFLLVVIIIPVLSFLVGLGLKIQYFSEITIIIIFLFLLIMLNSGIFYIVYSKEFGDVFKKTLFK